MVSYYQQQTTCGETSHKTLEQPERKQKEANSPYQAADRANHVHSRILLEKKEPRF